MSSKVTDKVCVVTGGGGGIGRALCESLAAAGARAVFVVDIHAQAAKDVADRLASLATHPHFRIGCDVANVGREEDVKRIVHSAWRTFGRIDVFFSNAGIFKVGGVSEKEVSNEDWEEIWQGGTFVITGSAAGLLMQPGCLPYHVTKHAAVSIADWLAVTHGDEGVVVHCLCPQAVRTDMLGSSSNRASSSFAKLAAVDGIAEPREVADATIKGIEKGTFLILPHAKVHKYFIGKATDYDRWIDRMRRMKKHFEEVLKSPPQSKL